MLFSQFYFYVRKPIPIGLSLLPKSVGTFAAHFVVSKVNMKQKVKSYSLDFHKNRFSWYFSPSSLSAFYSQLICIGIFKFFGVHPRARVFLTSHSFIYYVDSPHLEKSKTVSDFYSLGQNILSLLPGISVCLFHRN